jgi:hypothetical protein
MLPFQTENRNLGNFPRFVYRLLIMQTEVCHLFVCLRRNKQKLSVSKWTEWIKWTKRTCPLRVLHFLLLGCGSFKYNCFLLNSWTGFPVLTRKSSTILSVFPSNLCQARREGRNISLVWLLATVRSTQYEHMFFTVLSVHVSSQSDSSYIKKLMSSHAWNNFIANIPTAGSGCGYIVG